MIKNTQKSNIFLSFLRILTIISFAVTMVLPPAYAQVLAGFHMPMPGTMVSLTDSFAPVLLKGIKIFPDDPLRMDFIMDRGDEVIKDAQLQKQYMKIIKYFLAALTVPDDDMWVNLSPNEPDRIIPFSFGQTGMGCDVLAQDYVLKQLTASLLHPDQEAGRKFWKRIRREAKERFGVTDIPVDTFNKVWIMPEIAEVFENGDVAFVTQARLKVMLEEDYLSRKTVAPVQDSGKKDDSSQIAREIIREIIIPELEKEVNEGKNFSVLRQTYHALILAEWFKQNLRNNILNTIYANRAATDGIQIEEEGVSEQIYQQYLAAFKQGVYNFIKEDEDEDTGQIIPRKYFSGGVDYALLASETGNRLRTTGTVQQVEEDVEPARSDTVPVRLIPERNGDAAVNMENVKDGNEGADASMATAVGVIRAESAKEQRGRDRRFSKLEKEWGDLGELTFFERARRKIAKEWLNSLQDAGMEEVEEDGLRQLVLKLITSAPLIDAVLKVLEQIQNRPSLEWADLIEGFEDLTDKVIEEDQLYAIEQWWRDSERTFEEKLNNTMLAIAEEVGLPEFADQLEVDSLGKVLYDEVLNVFYTFIFSKAEARQRIRNALQEGDRKVRDACQFYLMRKYPEAVGLRAYRGIRNVKPYDSDQETITPVDFSYFSLLKKSAAEFSNEDGQVIEVRVPIEAIVRYGISTESSFFDEDQEEVVIDKGREYSVVSIEEGSDASILAYQPPEFGQGHGKAFWNGQKLEFLSQGGLNDVFLRTLPDGTQEVVRIRRQGFKQFDSVDRTNYLESYGKINARAYDLGIIPVLFDSGFLEGNLFYAKMEYIESTNLWEAEDEAVKDREDVAVMELLKRLLRGKFHVSDLFKLGNIVLKELPDGSFRAYLVDTDFLTAFNGSAKELASEYKGDLKAYSWLYGQGDSKQKSESFLQEVIDGEYDPDSMAEEALQEPADVSMLTMKLRGGAIIRYPPIDSVQGVQGEEIDVPIEKIFTTATPSVFELHDVKGKRMLVSQSAWPVSSTDLETIDKKLGHYQRIVELARLNPSRRMTVLDLGCGDGTGLIELHRELQRRGIRNVDVVGLSKEYYPKWNQAPEGIEFILADIKDVGKVFGAGSIDFVYSHTAVNHMFRSAGEGFAQQLGAVLKPGGEFRASPFEDTEYLENLALQTDITEDDISGPHQDMLQEAGLVRFYEGQRNEAAVHVGLFRKTDSDSDKAEEFKKTDASMFGYSPAEAGQRHGSLIFRGEDATFLGGGNNNEVFLIERANGEKRIVRVWVFMGKVLDLLDEDVSEEVLSDFRDGHKLLGDIAPKLFSTGVLEGNIPYAEMEYIKGEDMGSAFENFIGHNEERKEVLEATKDFLKKLINSRIAVLGSGIKPSNLVLQKNSEGKIKVFLVDVDYVTEYDGSQTELAKEYQVQLNRYSDWGKIDPESSLTSFLEGVVNGEESVGGIDFTSDELNLRKQGPGMNTTPEWILEDLQNIAISGFTPVILDVQPLSNLPLLLGKDESEEKNHDDRDTSGLIAGPLATNSKNTDCVALTA